MLKRISHCDTSIKSTVRTFLNSQYQILILTGQFGQCTQKIIRLAEESARIRNRGYTILSPAARIQYTLESKSLYGLLYQKKSSFNKSENLLIHDLSGNQDTPEHVYIIGDAQLVSNSLWKSGIRRFGSGYLLNDFMEFVDLHETKRKIIFIGDSYQLSRGKDLVPLKPTNLITFSKSVQHVQVDNYECTKYPKPFRENRRGFANRIDDRMFNRLPFSLDHKHCIQLSNLPSDMDQLIRDQNVIIVAYTHAQVHQFNQEIRKRVYGRGSELAVGDRVVTFSHISMKNDNDPQHSGNHDIPSGTFGVVEEISKEKPIKQPLTGRKDPIIVKFIRVWIRWEKYTDEHAIEHLCFADFLYREKPELSIDEWLALIVNARPPNKNNKPKESESADNKVAGEEMNTNDPYLNAAMLRFGYAITLHKAQGCLFQKVIADLSENQFHGGEAYLRWLYTAFSIPKQSIHLINVPSKNSFDHTVWQLDQSQLHTSIKPSNVIAYDPQRPDPEEIPEFPIDSPELCNLYHFIESRLHSMGAHITNLLHHNYQEIYSFELGGHSRCTLQFYYNAKFVVTNLSVQKSEPAEFAKQIMEALTSNIEFNNTFQEEIYHALSNQLIPSKLKISAVEHNDYQEVYYLQGGEGMARIRVYYNKSAAVTKVVLEQHTSEKIRERLTSIFAS